MIREGYRWHIDKQSRTLAMHVYLALPPRYSSIDIGGGTLSQYEI